MNSKLRGLVMTLFLLCLILIVGSRLMVGCRTSPHDELTKEAEFVAMGIVGRITIRSFQSQRAQ